MNGRRTDSMQIIAAHDGEEFNFCTLSLCIASTPEPEGGAQCVIKPISSISRGSRSTRLLSAAGFTTRCFIMMIGAGFTRPRG